MTDAVADVNALLRADARKVNARIAAISRRLRERRPGELGAFACECGDPSCRAEMLLTYERFEAVAQGEMRFLVVAGHEGRDHVCSAHGGVAIVEGRGAPHR